MKLAIILASVATFAAGTALAESSSDPTLAPVGSQVEAQVHFGVATAPFDVTSLPEAKGQAFVFLLAGRHALSAPFFLELNAPLVLGSVAQPAGSYVDATAWGNPELRASYRFVDRRSANSMLALSLALGVGAPLASYDDELMSTRLLAVADGIEGRGHPEWFTPGVLPITPSAALRWSSARWTLDGVLSLPWLVRVSEADLPSAASTPQTFGFASIVGAEASYRLSQRLSLSSAAHLFFDVAPPVQHVRNVSRLQDFERLSLHIHFGSRAALLVDLQTALGGELGGSTFGGGVRALVNME